MQYKKVDGICIAEENDACDDCELKSEVLCQFSKSYANKFLLGNFSYRILAIIIVMRTGLIQRGSEQIINCVECDNPLSIFIPPNVLKGKEQYQTVKKCTSCGILNSIFVTKAQDGSLNWQIGPAM